MGRARLSTVALFKGNVFLNNTSDNYMRLLLFAKEEIGCKRINMILNHFDSLYLHAVNTEFAHNVPIIRYL